jgi:hypothetical protein
MIPKKPQKNQFHKFIRFTGIGIQLGVTIYLAAYLGKKLDLYFGFEKTLTLLLVLFAFVISMYSLLQQLKKMED